MPSSIHELIVVLALAAIIFPLAKPIALRFSTAADFSRRRNVWFILTVTGFLTPSFWLYVLVAVPLLFWAGRKDPNPVALFLLLLHVVPPIPVDIPVVGINALFEVDNYRLLSFCVLIPKAWQLRKSKDTDRIRGMQAMDVLLLVYGALQVILFIPPDLPGHVILHDSITNDLRNTFLFVVDVYVVYYVVSRSCSTRRIIAEALAAFCLGCAVMAPIAVFESLKRWLLYGVLGPRWLPDYTGFAYTFYTFRGGSLRAQAASGQPLALGYLFAIALGFWFYLRSDVKSTATKRAVVLLYWLGLWAAYSRGPWIGAIVIYLVYVALNPRAFRKFFKAAIAALIIGAGILLSPLGKRIIDVVPFLGGTVDSDTALYRQRLAERAWELLQEHPFFGDPLVLSKMEDLRQGMGIVDLVNTYAEVALHYGLVGLALFLGFILMGLAKAYRWEKHFMRTDPDLALVGVCLIACIVGTLVMIISCSLIYGYEKMYYVLGGLAAAYAHLGRSSERAAANGNLGKSPEKS